MSRNFSRRSTEGLPDGLPLTYGEVVTVPGDGNCFYTSFAWWLFHVKYSMKRWQNLLTNALNVMYLEFPDVKLPGGATNDDLQRVIASSRAQEEFLSGKTTTLVAYTIRCIAAAYIMETTALDNGLWTHDNKSRPVLEPMSKRDFCKAYLLTDRIFTVEATPLAAADAFKVILVQEVPVYRNKEDIRTPEACFRQDCPTFYMLLRGQHFEPLLPIPGRADRMDESTDGGDSSQEEETDRSIVPRNIDDLQQLKERAAALLSTCENDFPQRFTALAAIVCGARTLSLTGANEELRRFTHALDVFEDEFKAIIGEFYNAYKRTDAQPPQRGRDWDAFLQLNTEIRALFSKCNEFSTALATAAVIVCRAQSETVPKNASQVLIQAAKARADIVNKFLQAFFKISNAFGAAAIEPTQPEALPEALSEAKSTLAIECDEFEKILVASQDGISEVFATAARSTCAFKTYLQQTNKFDRQDVVALDNAIQTYQERILSATSSFHKELRAAMKQFTNSMELVLKKK
jgi:hypothetical protein